MSRLPTAAVLVAVALSATAGCVSLSGHPPRHGPSRDAGQELRQGRDRESLVRTGSDPTAPDRPGSRAPGTASGSPGAAPTQPGAERPESPERDGDVPVPGRERANAPGAAASEDADDPDFAPEHRRSSPTARERTEDHRSEAPAPPAAPPAPPPSAPHRAPPSPPRSADPPPQRPSEPERPRPAPAPAPEQHRPAPAPPPRARPGTCAMGEQYGRWKQGSDASRICRQVYGG
ncbi:hypothetical protein [Streptomyces sp. I05A-00742]|uniref:hypothetical protein n=1 Tax=Streptomyces sp. I05A-00742 TaxID=2732853 RepID=UPI001487BBEA|nr:hypothetical protein [Streptomyces sp. I05A-00742]